MLLVTGVCEFPSFGYSVELRRKESRATDPRHLIVEKVVLHPVEPPAAATTRLEIRFEEPTPLEYDTVTILPDGVTLQVAATP